MGRLRRRQESIDEEEDLNDDLSSRGGRFSLAESFRWLDSSEHRKIDSDGQKNHRFIIHPKNRWYKAWELFILVWAIYSSLFTPMEFGFFRGLPKNLFVLDIVGQIAFLVDIVLLFFYAFRDSQTYKTDYKPTHIALRYLKSHFDAIMDTPKDLTFTPDGPMTRTKSREPNQAVRGLLANISTEEKGQHPHPVYSVVRTHHGT